MKLVIISNQAMIAFGKAERMVDETSDAVFPKGFDNFSDSKMKRSLEKLYRWPKGMLKNHDVVRLPDQLNVRPKR